MTARSHLLPLAALLSLSLAGFSAQAAEPSPAAAPAAPEASPSAVPEQAKASPSVPRKEEPDPAILGQLTPEQRLEYLQTWERERTTRAGTKGPEVWAPVTVFGSVVVMLAMVAFLIYRKDRLRHETIRAMVEKGTPVPPELLGAQPRNASDVPPSMRDMRRGVLGVALGTGLALFLGLVVEEPGVWSLGAIPAIIGLGYLLVAWVESRREPKSA